MQTITQQMIGIAKRMARLQMSIAASEGKKEQEKIFVEAKKENK